ncbi:MAG: ABC-F family ATP-binding cassette domain-containing protein [Candidatus Shapirobacteria bacterium]
MAKIENGKERTSVGSEVLSFSGVSFVSYDKVLFNDVNFKVHKGEIVSVVGESGCGKSVLLQLVTGRLQPDEGQVNINNKTTISYVPQNIEQIKVDKKTTIRDYYYAARGLLDINRRKEELESQMAGGSSDPGTLDKYGRVLGEYEQLGGYTADSEIEQILEGLKISKRISGHIDLGTKIGEVSSGQQTRLLIGRALFSASDLLVLDDPTSHLDVESVDWLAGFLKTRDQGVLIATQNISFAENCANRIVEITSFGRVITFQGKYSEYAVKRDSILAAERKAADAAMEKYQKLEATFLKFKGAGYFRRSRDFAQVGAAMQTRLERMRNELDDMPGTRDVYRQEKIKNQSFLPSHEGINPAVHIAGITKSYDGRHMALDLKHVDLTVKRGQILVIGGNNGSGKSTLMRIIEDSTTGKNRFTPDSGEIIMESGLTVGYNAPDRLDLPREGNIFELILNSLPRKNEAQATGILTFFGFSNQNLRLRTIETISSGEKKQLSLARIMAQQPDLILLDEPSDNLKADVAERLVRALNEFEGTAIVIAHDPEFIKKLDVDMELELPHGKVRIIRNSR